MKGDLITAATAAARLGISKEEMHKLIAAGRINAINLGSATLPRYYVNSDDVIDISRSGVGASRC